MPPLVAVGGIDGDEADIEGVDVADDTCTAGDSADTVARCSVAEGELDDTSRMLVSDSSDSLRRLTMLCRSARNRNGFCRLRTLTRCKADALEDSDR